jgi:hypothetical protein
MLCAAIAAHGQTQLTMENQEIHIAKTLQTRNVEVAKKMYQDKTFTSSSFNSKNANVGTFQYDNHLRMNSFLTKNYYGANYWAGNAQYQTATADAQKKSFWNITRFFTKSADVKTSTDAKKGYATQNFGTRPYLERGPSQDRFDKEGAKALTQGKEVGWQGHLGQMSIDDVRDLLNKSK